MKLLICMAMPFLLFTSCKQKGKLFREIKPEKSGIHFNNEIKEDENFNVLFYEYIYNGGGVGIGDFNNDSLPDIYFTGSRVSNKLFINKGNLKFEDITEAAGVSGNGRWCKGASIVDINNDGLEDIYVSAAVILPPEERKNLLYINKGIDKSTGVPIFKEEAEEYGLADTSSTQMAAFFDYDNDGDLDVYLLVNELDGTYPNEFRPIHKDGSWPNTDKLFRNDWNDSLRHPVFTDVSKQAGILIEGYGLGINITDINKDGWKDIYVSNDYLSNNHLYVNNKDGTFADRGSEYFKHTSRNAMGNDVADFNNDGLPDIVELDMAPADNYRLKMMSNNINYQTFQYSPRYGFIHQYMHNTLQLNMGPRLLDDDSIGEPVFSELAFYAGVAQTDWSWSPLAIDIDNDGYRDLMISNGLPKDMSDLNFISYRNQAMANTPAFEMLKQLPSVKINNYLFRNNGNYTFSDKTLEWGWDIPTFSAGMAYADLDRDGDIDIVINNTNMEASLFENTMNDSSANYLRIRLKGDSLNKDGIGATIHIYYKESQQIYEYTPYRGYMSTIENIAHFGLGKNKVADSVIVIWPDNRRTFLRNISSNQEIIIDKAKGTAENRSLNKVFATDNWFTDITRKSGIDFLSSEVDFIDFNIQRMIPHKLTQYGPSLAVADLNGDGMDDLVVGGGSPNYASIFLQTKTASFTRTFFTDTSKIKLQDDAGICVFDADNDNDPDIYIASGGGENEPGSSAYADHFYINDGKGNFTENKTAFIPNYTAKSCVRAADFDNDGDLDLFVGGRFLPGSYPQAVRSFIYQNDTKDGVVKFTDVTKEIAPDLLNIGLISDAAWSDVDNDGMIDLVIAGEWMPITIIKNNAGKLTKTNNGISDKIGWWNSITGADLDNDGDVDFVAGNFGTNGFIKPDSAFPIRAYAKDFDNNGSFDAVFSHYIQTGVNKPETGEYTIAGRDDFIREMNSMKGRFPDYSSFATREIKEIFSQEELQGATQLTANNFYTGWIENKGNMQFVFHSLPAQAQWAPVYGIVVSDFNEDGNPDIVLNGNEFSMAPALGRYDAFNGLLLQGDGKGNFIPLSIMQSGIYIPGNGKALVQLIVNEKPVLAAAQNASYLKLFQSKIKGTKILRINKEETYATVELKSGQKRKEEFGYGSSFFSQSGRFIVVNSTVKSIEITNNRKQKRVVNF
ncbi:MAG: VCBS repeat-containing protein [Bacteroidetes bacterium]|nr:VCBS repeat-containing protein [Bacteroidota bacterium]